MAKETGLGMTISVDDSGGTPRAISNDFTSLQYGTPRSVLESTGVNVSAMERLLALADMSFSGNGIFNDASSMSHDVFKTVPSTTVNRTTTIAISGQTLAAELAFSEYSLNRGTDGGLPWSVSGALADGTVPTWT